MNYISPINNKCQIGFHLGLWFISRSILSGIREPGIESSFAKILRLSSMLGFKACLQSQRLGEVVAQKKDERAN